MYKNMNYGLIFSLTLIFLQFTYNEFNNIESIISDQMYMIFYMGLISIILNSFILINFSTNGEKLKEIRKFDKIEKYFKKVIVISLLGLLVILIVPDNNILIGISKYSIFLINLYYLIVTYVSTYQLLRLGSDK